MARRSGRLPGILAAVLAIAGSAPDAARIRASEPKVTKPGCTVLIGKKQLKLYGKVKVVEHFADLKVQVVEHFPDLKVQRVEHFPDACGKWQFVEHFPDFTIQYVEHFPDLKIQYVEHFPGIP